MYPSMLLDLYNCIHEKDKEYFRIQREARFEKRLEEVCSTKEEKDALIKDFREKMSPVRIMFEKEGFLFLGGKEPSYAD